MTKFHTFIYKLSDYTNELGSTLSESRHCLLIILFFLQISATKAQTPFNCDNVAYEVSANLNGNSTLIAYNLPAGTFLSVAALPATYNAIGYNADDNFIWGINVNTSQLTRIDATGAITNYTVAGLPPLTNNPTSYHVGAMLPGSKLLVADGDDAAGVYYIIDLNTKTATTHVASRSIRASDLAYNPATGLVYGVTPPTAANPYSLFIMDPNTGAAIVSSQITGDGIQTEASQFGGAFYDASGSFYVLGNNSGKMWRVDINTFTATLVTTFPPTAPRIDGASCPNAILFPPPVGCVPAPTGVSANPNPVCPGASTTLTASCSQGSLSWFDDAGLTVGIGATVTPGSSRNYYAACIGADGCKSSAGSVFVTVGGTPAPTGASASPNPICPGKSTTLSASCSSGTLTWYDDAALTVVLSSTTVSPATTRDYYAACVGTCKSSGVSVNVVVYPPVPVPVPTTTAKTNSCPGLTANIADIQPPLAANTTQEWHTVASDPTPADLVPVPTAVLGGTYYLYAKSTITGCYSLASFPVTITIVICPPVYNPDFNVTHVNVPVPGNVKTNDKDVIPGTVYRIPIPEPGNPASCIPLGSSQSFPNTDGSYTFTCNKIGVYRFNVPVCTPAGVCSNVPLVITVLDATTPANNGPIANVDIASTLANESVTLKTLANDKSGNTTTNLNPASVLVITPPLHGTTSMNGLTGDITYTPNPGYVGMDTLTYTVCETATATKCATAKQIITVKPARANPALSPNTTVAADDYNYTPINTATSGNVMTNDTDAEGDAQIVTPQNTTVPGKGTLVLNSDGTYAFTPVTGYIGPVDFPYTTCDVYNPMGEACASATLHITVNPLPPIYNPDFNVTQVNVPVPGNVKTNDKDVVPGTSYNIPVRVAGNPSPCIPTGFPSTTGNYTFTCSIPGVYRYMVPVCAPSGSCSNVPLTITVTDVAAPANNGPIANVDITTTEMNTPVTLETLANDKSGNSTANLDTASVFVTVQPLHGVALVNASTGKITYYPDNGYAGIDTLTYKVCDTAVPQKCATAQQIITVKPQEAPNTTIAADDYNSTRMNTPVSGNVKVNDSDPEGDSQTVTAQTTTVTAGTLTLDALGNYTFTPATGFTGPVDFPYTTCDSKTPKACASATLHITVNPLPAVYNPDFNVTQVNVPVPGNVKTNDKDVVLGTVYNVPVPEPGNPANCVPTGFSNFTGDYTFTCSTPGVYKYMVSVCIPSGVCSNVPLVITVTDITAPTNNGPIANVDIATTPLNTPVTLKTLANDKSGNTITNLNPASVTVITAPLHGTTAVNTNGLTGDITYTPNNGYTGTDTLTYRVCDTAVPSKCATAKQIITINLLNPTNSTVAADDYNSTRINTPVSGNVKTNDSDPEGNPQTVTPQTTTVTAGTLTLDALGAYTFTPATGFTGPVDFPYTTCDDQTPKACASATLHITVNPFPPVYNPDFNVTQVNVPVPGNVKTNDKDVVPGSSYNVPVPELGNPANCVPTGFPNPTGDYTFTCSTPGVYKYMVPVCTPAGVCSNVPLVITVTDVTAPINNGPIANVDIATTPLNTPVTLKTLANDKSGNTITNLNPASVTVITQPLHGVTSVNASTGNITYTPNNGYSGTDTLTYRVCDTAVPPKCATAKQIITINLANPANSTVAADDYNYTAINVPVSGNVMTNDSDPEGNPQAVTAQNTTIAGKGTLVLSSLGAYTFTPVTGFTGPVDFPYTTCDNQTPQACASATLHITVNPLPPVYNPDFNVTQVNVPVPGNVKTNDKDVVPNTVYKIPVPEPGNPSNCVPSGFPSATGAYTFTCSTAGVYRYMVPVCTPAGVCSNVPLVITVTDVATPANNGPIANVDIATTPLNTPVILPTLANDKSGNTITNLNPASVTVITAPLHGVTSVNASTGEVTYTPNNGYAGTDTLTYRVCDTAVPSKCATAKQIITINLAIAPNSTVAADDYNYTSVNVPVSGDVKTNDSDPERDAQKVVAQNITVPAGTLVLDPSGTGTGTYTFTPALNFTGPIDFPYTTCDNGIPQACASATLHITVNPLPPVYNPDFNVTQVNVPVPGNVKTNDKDVVPGTAYRTPVPEAGNPTNCMPTGFPSFTGAYTFTCGTPGVYKFNVPVCTPAGVCSNVPLVITVTDVATPANNGPIANVDIATTPLNTPVTLKTLANDKSGNTITNLNTASVVVITAPLHGATSVNAGTGNITYTPNNGYAGTDTLTYQVCDTGVPSKCATAKQIITINLAIAPNSTVAADDYNYTPMNEPVIGNVKTNDSDPEGNTQMITPQTTTVPAGTLTLTDGINGNYTFTPAPGFTGPVDFPYQTCDNGTPQACAWATLHITVNPAASICLMASVYLQGALMSNTINNGGISTSSDGHPLMRDNLRSSPYLLSNGTGIGANYIPSIDPYQVAVASPAGTSVNVTSKYTHVGPGLLPEFKQVTSPTVFTITGENAIVDWVFVELRSKSNSATIVATRSGLLQRDGNIVHMDGVGCLAFPGVAIDDYYVAVRHRNHLGAMTATAQTLTQLNAGVDMRPTTTPLFDFGITKAATNAGANYTGLATNNTVISGWRALWAGNFNTDLQDKYSSPNDDTNVLFSEVLTYPTNLSFVSNYDFALGYLQGDYNMDSKVKFSNPNDDKNLLFGQLLGYPLNMQFLSNYNYLIQQLP